GDSAGRLIDACGLKSFRVGTAWVSERHANFFQAEPDGGGRATDVVALVLEVQRRDEEATGVRLVPELRRVAFAGQAGSRPGAPRAWPGEDHAAVAGAPPEDRRSSGTPVVREERRSPGGGMPQTLAGRVLAAVAAVVLFTGATWVTTRSSLLDVDHIEVSGGSVITPDQAVVGAHLHRGQPMISVDAAAAERHLRSLPWVQTARVERAFPNTVKIH